MFRPVRPGGRGFLQPERISAAGAGGVLNTATNAASHVLVITSGVISMGVTLVLAIVFSVYMLSGRGSCSRSAAG